MKCESASYAAARTATHQIGVDVHGRGLQIHDHEPAAGVADQRGHVAPLRDVQAAPDGEAQVNAQPALGLVLHQVHGQGLVEVDDRVFERSAAVADPPRPVVVHLVGHASHEEVSQEGLAAIRASLNVAFDAHATKGRESHLSTHTHDTHSHTRTSEQQRGKEEAATDSHVPVQLGQLRRRES